MSKVERERVLLLGDDMRIFLTVARSLGRAGKKGASGLSQLCRFSA